MSDSKVFHDYASFYDIIYADKDYAAEVEWTVARIAELGVVSGRWGDIGCGTGRHLDCVPADRFERFGADPSPAMVQQAMQRLPDVSIEVMAPSKIPFEGPLDVVSAFFAVGSYMAEPGGFDGFLTAAAKILRPGGVLYFDVWHGAPVLIERPEMRWKRYALPGGELLRMSRPDHHYDRQVVDVHYELVLTRGDLVEARVKELHSLRYYFPREVEEACRRHGFAVRLTCPFMDHARSIGEADWSMAVFATPMRKSGASSSRYGVQ